MTNSFDIKARREHDETIRSRESASLTAKRSSDQPTGDQGLPPPRVAFLRSLASYFRGRSDGFASEYTALGCASAADEYADMLAALTECADDLAGEINAHYSGVIYHPVMARKFERDMEPVHRARAVIAKATGSVSEHQSSASGNDAGQPKADGPESNRAKATGAPAS